MANWERLGHYVVARRVELGYMQRQPFADDLGISMRTLSDIEKGRRGNYDPVTLANLERVLRWTTGSAMRVAEGHEPTLRPEVITTQERINVTDHVTATVTPADSRERGEDEAVARVMRSNLSDDQKRKLVKLLTEEREAADRQRAKRAEELIHLLEDGR